MDSNKEEDSKVCSEEETIGDVKTNIAKFSEKAKAGSVQQKDSPSSNLLGFRYLSASPKAVTAALNEPQPSKLPSLGAKQSQEQGVFGAKQSGEQVSSGAKQSPEQGSSGTKQSTEQGGLGAKQSHEQGGLGAKQSNEQADQKRKTPVKNVSETSAENSLKKSSPRQNVVKGRVSPSVCNPKEISLIPHRKESSYLQKYKEQSAIPKAKKKDKDTSAMRPSSNQYENIRAQFNKNSRKGKYLKREAAGTKIPVLTTENISRDSAAAEKENCPKLNYAETRVIDDDLSGDNNVANMDPGEAANEPPADNAVIETGSSTSNSVRLLFVIYLLKL